VGGVTFGLLYLKEDLHGLVTEKIGDKDMRAIMVFVAVAFVVAPILPNAPYGPYGVWNPFRIWLVVVLVVGIGLAGYVAAKVFGRDAGTALAGILGGVISSTATTISYARRSAGAPRAVVDAAMVVIVIASTVTYPRLAVEVSVVAPSFARTAVPPLLVMTTLAAAVSLVTWFRHRNEETGLPEQENPTQFRSAVLFGCVFAVVLLAAAWGQDKFGTGAAYVIAAIGGTTDLDALTLSNAALAGQGKLSPDVAWRAILLGAVSNQLFKLAAVAVLGHRRLLVMLAGALGVHIVGALVLILFWPARFAIPS
jgi:uncharacterized membrane protein (DUF4010 family)